MEFRIKYVHVIPLSKRTIRANPVQGNAYFSYGLTLNYIYSCTANGTLKVNGDLSNRVRRYEALHLQTRLIKIMLIFSQMKTIKLDKTFRLRYLQQDEV